MEFLTDPGFWSRWLRMVFIDLALAGELILRDAWVAVPLRELPALAHQFVAYEVGEIIAVLGSSCAREESAKAVGA